MKSEPGTYSWGDLKRDRATLWDGVRNYQARNNMKLMAVGDQVLFYHSGADKEVVGVMEIKSPAAEDPADKNFVVLKVAPLRELKAPITLKQIKADPLLVKMEFVRQSRLSVSKVSAEEFEKFSV